MDVTTTSSSSTSSKKGNNYGNDNNSLSSSSRKAKSSLSEESDSSKELQQSDSPKAGSSHGHNFEQRPLPKEKVKTAEVVEPKGEPVDADILAENLKRVVFTREGRRPSRSREREPHERGRSRSASPQQPKRRQDDGQAIVTEEQLKANYHNVVQRIHAVLKAPLAQTLRGFGVGLSISGCGFLGSYHFGVVLCFKKNASRLMSRVTHVGGASVGSLIATLIVLAPESIEAALKQLYVLADEINATSLGAMTPGFCLAERLSFLVDKFVPDDISPANGRLYISITKQANHANRMVSTFPSREYLMSCLSASCYIPIYSNGYFATPPVIDGERYVDGGYSNNLPIFENVPTMTISPFSGSAIIAPTDHSPFDWKMRLGNQVMRVNLQNVVRGAQALFPPSTSVLKRYYDMGYHDAMTFLIQNNFFERAEGTEI